MHTQVFSQKLRAIRARLGLLLFSAAAALCICWLLSGHAGAVYILTGAEDSAIVLDGEAQVGQLSSKLVHLSGGADGYDVTLTSGQDVTVLHNGEPVTAKARTETVEDLLERLHITPSPLEMVAVDVSGDSATLTISSELTYYDQVEEPAPHGTVRVANASLPKGTEQVVQEGVDGVRTSI